LLLALLWDAPALLATLRILRRNAIQNDVLAMYSSCLRALDGNRDK
jgi:hypothetical protein